MDKEHILPQDFELSIRYAGPFPDQRFTGNTLEELYLDVCKEGYEFRRFERIGVDAGARMYTPGVTDCRIEPGKISIEDRLDIGFDVFRRRLFKLLQVIHGHVGIEPVFGVQIELAAIWPTEKETDLREIFTPGLVNLHREHLDVLAADVDNVSLMIACSARTEGDTVTHYRLELAPDISDPHRLRIRVDAHYHEVVTELSQLEQIVQQVYDFLMDRAGRFVESLAMEK